VSARGGGGNRMIKTAVLSEDKKYRYLLGREWDHNKPCICFVMLNPSTADAEIDDATIRRCTGFARAWGYGSLLVVNLYGLRATHPKALWYDLDPVGPKNDDHIILAVHKTKKVVCAWVCSRRPGYECLPVNSFYQRWSLATKRVVLSGHEY